MREQLQEVIGRLGMCARCRQCRMVSERPLPKTLLPICPSGEFYKFDAYYASGRVTVAKRLLRGDLELDHSVVDLIYSCALCRACQQQCPITEMDPVEATVILRQLAVEANLTDGHYLVPSEKPLNIQAEGHTGSDVGLFVGCESQSDGATVDTVAQILTRLGISFQVLGGYCCGAYLERKGDKTSFKKRLEANTDVFLGKGIKRIICHDPMCYKVLKRDYALEEKGIEVKFYLELVAEAIRERGLQLRTGAESLERVSYHDPCYLGRYMGMYDVPRELIAQMYGSRFVELERNRENALCCGGVPDWSALHHAAAEETGREQIRKAEEAGVGLLLTSCGRCTAHLREASKGTAAQIKARNLAEVLAQALSLGR